MVKLKNVPTENTEGQVKDTEEKSEVAEVTTQEITTNDTEERNKEEATEEKIIEGDAIPEYADKVLKMYPNYAKLAIDAQGGVYTEDSKLVHGGKAILYKNPYYK